MTKHKKADSSDLTIALRETRDLQSAILKNTHVSIACLDREFNFIVVNEIYAQSDGHEPEYFIGKNHFSLFPNAENETIFRGVIETGEPYFAWAKPFEYAEHPERGISYWDWSLKPVRDDNGLVSMIVLTLLDVTSRVKAEESLRESEKRFRQLADAMPQLVWTAEPDGILDYYNERYKEYYNPDGREFFKWEFAIHSEDIEPTINAWRHAVENGYEYQMEHRVKMKSGDFRWHLSRAVPAYDSEKRIVKWYGTTTDIDESKKSAEELVNSKKKLDMALENANVGLWEMNARTREASMDEKSERMFGLEPGSFDGTLEGLEKLVHEEDLEHVKRSIDDTLHHHFPFQTIFRTRPVNGTVRYISSKAMVTKDQNGEILTITGVNFDITELKEGTENLISSLNMDLLRSNSDLQQFAYVASHDLQEPLRTISSFTQLLQMKYADKLDQDANEYINYAVNGSKRMYDLINSLLAYSRVQTKAEAFSVVSMESVLRKVKENLNLLIRETKAELTSGKLPEVTADENQMIQVLQNLIENGIKFSKGIPRIHISSESREGMYLFSVSDQGIGIQKEYYEKIFRIFQRLHAQQEYKGTGIGLALCKRIIERHGGRIWVESQPDHGSVFYFTLPEIKQL